MKFFEDFLVGDRSETSEYTVHKDEVVSFAKVWDPQPFHIDEEAAGATHYGGLIACSAHIFAIFTKLSNSLEPKAAALGALGFDEIRIPNPVRIGNRIRLRTECVEVRRSNSKPDRGIVRSAIKLINQDDVVVFTCSSAFLVQSRDASTSGDTPQ